MNSNPNIPPAKPENALEGANSEEPRQRSTGDGEDAVVDAFSGDSISEDAFRERWKPAVLEAQTRRKRAEEEKAEKQRQEALQKAKEERAKTLRAAERDTSSPIDTQLLDAAGFGAKKADIPEEPVRAGRVDPPRKKTVYRPVADAQGYAPEDGCFVFNGDAPEDGFIIPDVEDFFTHEKTAEKSPAAQKTQSAEPAEPPVKKQTVTDTSVKKNASQRVRFRFKTDFNKEGFKRFLYQRLPNKNDSGSERFRKVINVLSALVLTAGLCYLAVYGVKYAQRIYMTKSFEDDINSLTELNGEQLEAEWKNIQAKYPDVVFPEGMNIEYANLYAINQDVVGYLSIANTNIQTVLMQRPDDDYYLYRDIYKQKSRYGNPFVSAKCAMGKTGLSKNTIIYGHNTHDNLMFHQLTYYMTPDGYLNAPIVTLNTLYETTKWKIFAVMLTNSTPDADNGNVFEYLFSSYKSDEDFLASMNAIKARSILNTGVDVAPTDKTLMLYTCYQNIFTGGRLVVVARQLRQGESEQINASLVTYNGNCRYPQAYYDKKGLTNPFAATAR